MLIAVGYDLLMDKNEKLAWAAGYLSATGSLLVSKGRPLLVIKTSSRGASLQRFADCVDMNLRVGSSQVNGKTGDKITISGNRLHILMTKLWPYLPEARKRDYARVRRASAQ